MPIMLPVKRAWDGFCNKFVELQTQGRTIAESSDGRYRITLSANAVGAHIMVFDDDEVVYDENVITKDQFEDELVYLYDLYIESYEAEFEGEDEIILSDDGVSCHEDAIDEALDILITELSPSIVGSAYYPDIKEDIRHAAEDALLMWGYATRI